MVPLGTYINGFPQYLYQWFPSVLISMVSLSTYINGFPQYLYQRCHSVLISIVPLEVLEIHYMNQIFQLAGRASFIFTSVSYKVIVKIFFLVSIAIPSFLFGLIFMQDSGEYVLQLFNSYSIDIPLLVIALCELLVIVWIYGVPR